MRDITDVIKTTPIAVQKSVRSDEIRAITSHYAGKMVPIKYIPLLREDRVATSAVNIEVEMTETALPLMNAISYTARAWFVPFLAMERFEGSLDRMNRSYKGEPDKEGGDIVPFFETINYDRTADIFRAMGLHAKQGEPVNAAPVQAYNVLTNHMYRLLSKNITPRDENDLTLAACPWNNTAFRHLVPDFDQAMLDGEASLEISGGKFPVKGITAGSQSYGNYGNQYETGANSSQTLSANGANIRVQEDPDNPGFPGVFAELEANGITLSMANIEQAKKTAAFAAMRKKYDGLDEDHLIDMLMEGLRVPDAGLAQPILLDTASTIVGYSQRWASDAGNLDQSVTTGMTQVSLKMRTPPMNTGGIVMITVEAVPEQLFERQKDYFLHTSDPDQLPSFTRDYLDPEKVSVVQNDHVDVEHTQPDGTFAYAPLNHEWRRSLPNVGGKYQRQIGDAFDENRQKIWSNEQEDPELTSDFYLATNIHHKVFKSSNVEPFEVTALGRCQIVGNTVFGAMLEEDSDDYSILKDQTDETRIDQDA